MAEHVPPALLKGCGLPLAWANQAAWRVLETGMGDWLGFLGTWAAWKNDPHRPRMLHYVAITPAVPVVPDVARHLRADTLASDPHRAAQAQALAAQCFGLLPGFHRLVFEQGQVLLTLCIGDLNDMLREQRFEADSVYLNVTHGWDQWHIKSLARCCRRGTGLAMNQATLERVQMLKQGGFELQCSPAATAATTTGAVTGAHIDEWQGTYNPRWEPKTTRHPFTKCVTLPSTCVVVGAGLAGASMAAALARRGWRVQVLDAAAEPAAGASGLPVGLMVPHVSGDDSPRSRLSRSGVRQTLAQARSLLVQGQDWSATGVLERRLDGSTGLPQPWPQEGLDWSQPQATLPADAPWRAHLPDDASALWHTQAAWIKPGKLVRAWLAQPGVRFKGDAAVASIDRAGNEWVLQDAGGNALAHAALVVLATATGSNHLLDQLAVALPEHSHALHQLPSLQGIPGQVSWAMQRDSDGPALPPFPVNGLGSLVPHVPFTLGLSTGMAWFAGASFETQGTTTSAASVANQHRANHQRLATLLPAAGDALADQFETGAVQVWRDTRCAAADRLPVLGPLMAGDKPTLWISTGMGARGLSMAALCAELLAARLGGEPWPMEGTLAKAIDSLRKHKEKQPLAHE